MAAVSISKAPSGRAPPSPSPAPPNACSPTTARREVARSCAATYFAGSITQAVTSLGAAMPSPDTRGPDASDPSATLEAYALRTLADDFYADPYPVYAALRRHAPVKRMPDGSYFLTRHADIEAVYKDAARFSSDKRVEFRPKYGDSPLYQHHMTSLVFNDAPLHSRVRRLIAGALTPRAIGVMEPAIIALVDALLDAIARKGSFDIIADFAPAIPLEVIPNLLALPRPDPHTRPAS